MYVLIICGVWKTSEADRNVRHTIVTLGYHHDQVEFADEVRAHVAKYASKSAEEWRRELLEA